MSFVAKHITEGERFYQRTATGNHKKNKIGNREEWFDEVICDCGNVRYVQRSQLRRGSSKNCGCNSNIGAPKHIKVGERFGMLTATGVHETRKCKDGKSRIYEEVVCDCGMKKIVTRESLFRGTASCGCLKKKNHYKKHGDTGTRFYGIWCGIIDRCNNKNNKSYDRYGGRGITCLWGNYEEFKRDMYKSYEEHIKEFGEHETTLDRIDNDKGYSKDNCRWATYKEQSMNRRFTWKNKFGTSLEELGTAYGYNPNSIRNRYSLHGKDITETINHLKYKIK